MAIRYLHRLALAGLGAGAVLSLFLAPAQADPGTTLVDDMHAVFGKHHGQRAVHAKGIVLEGTFTPTAEAKELSTAAVFAGETIPVTVRLSAFTGLPAIADNSLDSAPRGLAVKFRVPNARPLDVVAHGFNGFPVATAGEFSLLLRAIAASNADAPKPTALDRFLESHPIAKSFLTSQNPPPVSYATEAQFGVNAFAFIDAKGQRTLVRYRFRPAAGEHHLDAAAREASGPNYLRAEMEQRLAKAPVVFDWLAQVAEPGDKADDPSVAWPKSRRLVRLGTLRIERIAADEEKIARTLVFMPGNPPPGIEAADPMLAARNEAYSVSFDERQ
jgi:catalase